KSGAFRSVKLVRGETRGIDERNVEVDLAECLHATAVQQHAALATNFRDLLPRLDHAGLVVRGNDRTQARFRPNRVRELIQVNNSILGNVEPGHFKAFVFLQMLDRVQHGVVLSFFANDVTATIQSTARKSKDGEIARFRAAAGEND